MVSCFLLWLLHESSSWHKFTSPLKSMDCRKSVFGLYESFIRNYPDPGYFKYLFLWIMTMQNCECVTKSSRWHDMEPTTFALVAASVVQNGSACPLFNLSQCVQQNLFHRLFKVQVWRFLCSGIDKMHGLPLSTAIYTFTISEIELSSLRDDVLKSNQHFDTLGFYLSMPQSILDPKSLLPAFFQ